MAASSPSQWHLVNPQTRPLTLSILELTPLALTLSLTLAPGPSNHTHHIPTHHHTHTKHRKKIRHRRVESDDDLTAVEIDDADHPTHQQSPLPGSWPNAVDLGTSFKDLLSHGVVVSVNGQSWSRIVAHVSDPDHGDEHEENEEEWEDEAEQEQDSEGGGEEGGVTRRRPRKARFSLSAGHAVGGSPGSGASGQKERRRRRPSEVGKDKVDKDRAVVVVYGLSPGKEYEIELRVVGLSMQDGDGVGESSSAAFCTRAKADRTVSNAILIPPSPSPNNSLHPHPHSHSHPRSRANSLRSRSIPRSRSNSVNASAQQSSDSSPGGNTPPTMTNHSDASIPIPTSILSPVDTQAAQIRHLTASAHVEKDHVQTQIKEARRASQRAEAALRVEIETVKKAIDKAGSLDLRAKQKALALQEQVKQGWAGAELAEKDMGVLEEKMAELEDRLEATRLEVESVKVDWKVVKDKEDEVREKEKKARTEEERKLAEVVGKLDKLRLKKEKKEQERVELERRLEELEKQKDDADRRHEEEKNHRRSGIWNARAYEEIYGHEGRSLTAHPSLSNLSGQYAAGPAYRPRGGAPGYQPRFPSAGARAGPTSSPTHPAAFHASPQYPTNTTSPAFRPARPVTINANSTGGSAPIRQSQSQLSVGSVSSGVNVAALPFHPSSTHFDSTHHHTTLMPPQLQHRIYVRPRPSPNFHPPPSVMAEQHQHQHQNQNQQQHLQQHQSQHPHQQTISSQLQTQTHGQGQGSAFPPLPSQGTGDRRDGKGGVSLGGGPSLASIVTRAVLSPTSALARTSPPPSAKLGNVIGTGSTGGSIHPPTSPTNSYYPTPAPSTNSHSPTPPKVISPGINTNPPSRGVSGSEKDKEKGLGFGGLGGNSPCGVGVGGSGGGRAGVRKGTGDSA